MPVGKEERVGGEEEEEEEEEEGKGKGKEDVLWGSEEPIAVGATVSGSYNSDDAHGHLCCPVCNACFQEAEMGAVEQHVNACLDKDERSVNTRASSTHSPRVAVHPSKKQKTIMDFFG